MKYVETSKQKLFLRIGSLITWLVLILQLILILENRVTAVPETTIRFFSYFTIQTNILVALCFTALGWKSKSRFSRFFTNPNTVTAIAVYITIVALIYNTVLRFIMQLEGLQLLVDTMLHVIIPIGFVVYWYFFVNNTTVKWKDVFLWLIFPLAYLIYTIVRGSFVDFYPYPFVDVKKLGLNSVLINSFFVALTFLLFSLLYVFISKRKNRNLKGIKEEV